MVPMRRVRELRIILRSGETGLDTDVALRINGHRIVARKLAGGTDSGEVMLSSLFVGAAVDSLLLLNESAAAWDVHDLELFGILEDDALVYQRLRPDEALAPGDELNLWEGISLELPSPSEEQPEPEAEPFAV